MTARRRLALLVMFLASGCSAYRAANQPLTAWDPSHGYRPEAVEAKKPVGEVLLLLAFSGGGTRAAALSYGVLRELRDTRLPIDGDSESLLGEVDMITSVSGGSFTSAYYGLFGERIFEDYEKRFLRRNVQGRLIWELLRPWNWFRLASSFFDRTELAIRLYDREIFDGATFADLEAAGGPYLAINAADLAVGNPFTFTQPQFDLMCSDLSQLEVARAVAASSAVPGLFTPITLRNYAGACGFQRPDWLDEALASRRTSPRRFRDAEIIVGYLDAKRRKYIHLVDGGISDNIGLRLPLSNVIVEGGIWKHLKHLGIRRPGHIVVIAVNAANEPDQRLDLVAKAPSLKTVVGSVSGVQIHRYNFETLDLMRESLERWARDAPPDEEGRKVQTHMIEVAFDLLEDPEERHFFNNVATSFNLDDETVDRLIEVGERLLRESPDFQELLGALQVSNHGGNIPLPEHRA